MDSLGGGGVGGVGMIARGVNGSAISVDFDWS